MAEREFTLRMNVKTTIEIESYEVVTITAESLADAKRKAERECHEIESAENWMSFTGGTIFGCAPVTVQEVEVEVEGLLDEVTDEEHGSLGIEDGDDQPFSEEGE